MIGKRWVLAGLFLLVSLGDSLASDPYASWPELSGPYLGQETPGKTVQVFAEGIVKPPTRFHSSILFNPDGTEAYWTAQGGVSWLSKYERGRWQKPVALPFNDEYGVREPFLTDGASTLYYLSRRPVEDDPVERERLWSVSRRDGTWSQPTVIDAVVRAHPTHWQFSFTSEGDLYFTSEIRPDGGQGDIFVSRHAADGFTEPQDVGPGVNSPLREFCPFIAPDESYLIFSRSEPGVRADLFVSFRENDGSWGSAVAMRKDINSEHNEVSPLVTPDGRYLIFLRASGSYNEACWVDATVIESLR